jgi:RNA polymerase sigma-70 factor (ECF subfamily)
VTETDDRTLVTRIAAGEEEALRVLYDRYKAPLGRFLWPQVGGDRLALEEIFQDVFLTVWRTAPRFRGDARVSTWLFQIAHYRVCHMRRDQARRPRSDAFPPAWDCDSPVPELDPEWQRASHEGEVVRRISLEDALDHLSMKHRVVLDLAFQQGFTLHEVASILEVPVGTVKSRISAAKRELQRALDAADTPHTRRGTV